MELMFAETDDGNRSGWERVLEFKAAHFEARK